MKIRDYKFGFNLSAVILFTAIMLPNIVWFFVPSQNDILRNESSVPVLDIFVTVFQILILATLCVLKNVRAEKIKFSRYLSVCAAFAFLYYLFWILYYCGITHPVVLICLSLFPCCSFLFYAIDRKNYIAVFPIIVFSALHFSSTVINFLV